MSVSRVQAEKTLLCFISAQTLHHVSTGAHLVACCLLLYSHAVNRLP